MEKELLYGATLSFPPTRPSRALAFGLARVQFCASGKNLVRTCSLYGPHPTRKYTSQFRMGGSVLIGCPPVGVRFGVARFGLATLHFFISHS